MSKNNNHKKVGEIVSKSKINFTEAADNTEKTLENLEDPSRS